MKTKPYPYQTEGVRLIAKTNGRTALCDEQGLGKSYQAIAWYHQYLRPKTDKPVIVVAPATVKWNWQHEFLHHFGLRAEVLSSIKPPRFNSRAFIKNRIMIINWDILYAWTKWLRRQEPALIIGDEVQNICNMEARRSRAFHRLCQGVPHVLCLSGTPITHRPAQLFSMASILWPERFNDPIRFYWKFTQPEKIYGKWHFKGSNNLDLLHRILKKKGMVRRLKKDVLKDLPAKIRSVIPLDIQKRKMYHEALHQFRIWMQKYNPQTADRARRAERLTQIGYLKRLAAELKLESVKKWVREFLNDQEGKLIVFGVHKKILRPLYEEFKKVSVLLDGEVVGRKRQMVIDRFTRDKNTRVLFGNIIAAGVGWNGTVANTVAFAEMTWDPASHVQAEDRTHRIGQKRSVNIYYLIAKGTFEETLAQIIQKKQRVLDKIMDGKVDTSGLSVFNELIDSLMEKPHAKAT